MACVGHTTLARPARKSHPVVSGVVSRQTYEDMEYMLCDTCFVTHAVCVNCTAFLNPEDLDKLWMEAPKTKPAKQYQKPVLSKQGSLEKGNSHEGFVGHAADSIDDMAATGDQQKSSIAPPPSYPQPCFSLRTQLFKGPYAVSCRPLPLAVPILTMAWRDNGPCFMPYEQDTPLPLRPPLGDFAAATASPLQCLGLACTLLMSSTVMMLY